MNPVQADDRPNKRKARYTDSLMCSLFTGAVFWCVWNDSFSLLSWALGALLTGLAILITNHMLLKAPYQELFHINIVALIKYVAVLIIAIFESGFHAIYITLSGRIDVNIVDLQTDIENPFHGVMIANAITLTPGTVTVEHQKGSFKVLWIESPTKDLTEAAEMIKGRFERVLLPTPRKEHA